MRYIEYRRNGRRETCIDEDIRYMPGLTRKAAEIMENKRRAILKTSWGVYRIIKECGLGCPEENHPDFTSLKEADAYIKALKK